MAPGPTATPLPRAANKWGVHLLLDDGVSQWPVDVWEQHLAYARWVVGDGGFVLELVRVDDLDVSKWRAFVDAARRLGLRPIIRLATFQDRAAGHWTAPKKDENGRTYRDIARRYAAFVARLGPDEGPLFVTVGNEPNRGDEWGGRPNAADYAQFLVDVAEAVRREAPRATILNGALDLYAPNTGAHDINGFRAIDAETFLAGMAAHDRRAFEVIDAWASHPYPVGPFLGPPSARGFQIDDLDDERRTERSRPPGGLANRGVNAYQWELYRLRALGVTRRLPVLVTETGWRHRDVSGPSADAAMAHLPSTTVAEYIRQAFEGEAPRGATEPAFTPWLDDSDVLGVVLFALDGHPARWGHTNLVEIDEQGRIQGLKPGFAPLIKQS